MTSDHFIKTHLPIWERLEYLTQKAQNKGLRALTEKELHELTRLYPSVAVDVARAKLYRVDAITQNKINAIAIASHGVLYRRKQRKYFRVLKSFFITDYPAIFRENIVYVLLSVIIFAMGMSGAYISTRLQPANAYVFVPGQLDLTGDDEVSSADISERFRQMDRPPLAAGVITNNVTVAINTFAFGITAGIGTAFLLFYNAMMLGGFVAHFVNHQLAYAFFSFILPHGALEIFAILIASAAGFKVGFSFAMPGGLKRLAALRIAAKGAVLLVLGTIPMFIIAGLIEGFITPSYIHGTWKIVLGIGVWGSTLVYLFFGGKKPSKLKLHDASGCKTL